MYGLWKPFLVMKVRLLNQICGSEHCKFQIEILSVRWLLTIQIYSTLHISSFFLAGSRMIRWILNNKFDEKIWAVNSPHFGILWLSRRFLVIINLTGALKNKLLRIKVCNDERSCHLCKFESETQLRHW